MGKQTGRKRAGPSIQERQLISRVTDIYNEIPQKPKDQNDLTEMVYTMLMGKWRNNYHQKAEAMLPKIDQSR